MLVAIITVPALHLQWTPANGALVLGFAVSEAGAASAGTEQREPLTPGVSAAGNNAGPVLLCDGDCNTDGEVTIDDLIHIVDIVLGADFPSSCASTVFVGPNVSDVIRAVNSALRGCLTFTYRLTAESNIVYSAGPDSSDAIIEEPLSGTFLAVPAVPNEGDLFFRFTLKGVDFQSPSFRVSGHPAGEIKAITLSPPGLVPVCATVSINQQPAVLVGASTFAALACEVGPCDYPPRFTGLEMCGDTDDLSSCGQNDTCSAIRAGSERGYSITIFAEPMND